MGTGVSLPLWPPEIRLMDSNHLVLFSAGTCRLSVGGFCNHCMRAIQLPPEPVFIAGCVCHSLQYTVFLCL